MALGTSGNDVLRGTRGDDFLNGLAGNDKIFGGAGDDQLVGGPGRDKLLGQAGNDLLKGNGGVDLLDGGGGNDRLDGGWHNDTLLGGSGNDVLIGGNGQDTLTGGTDADVFRFGVKSTSADHALADVITDFSSLEGDIIDLKALDAKTAVPGNQAFSFIGEAAFGAVAGQLRFEKVAGDNVTYVEGDTNGDGVADFAIALSGLVDLSAADFIL